MTELAITDEEFELGKAAVLEKLEGHDRNLFLEAPLDKQKAIVIGAKQDALEVSKRLSPRGKLNLPRLLDERRLQYGIVDRAFTHHRALFDCVLVYQIPQFEGDTYGDGKIVMPEPGKRREELESARCVVVSAGQKALDELRSHGVDLGHIVHVCKHTPLRQRIDMVNGHAHYLLMVRPGDLTDSEDLAQAFVSGDVKIAAVKDERTGAFVHQLQLRDETTGEYSPPVPALMPWIPEDS